MMLVFCLISLFAHLQYRLVSSYSYSSSRYDLSGGYKEYKLNRLGNSGSALDSAYASSTLKQSLLNKISGEPNSAEKDLEIKEIIKELESRPSQSPTSASLLGEWTLIFADDDHTRTSPFFWAFRKAFQDFAVKDPLQILGTESFAEAIFKITDSIPVKEIGFAEQLITETELISKVEVKVAKLPFESRSIMTTTSKWTDVGTDLSGEKPGLNWELRVEKTQALESTLRKTMQSLPLFPKQLNDLIDRPFPSGEALERVKPGSSLVYMKHTYVDSDLRISRNERDDKVFVFLRKN